MPSDNPVDPTQLTMPFPFPHTNAVGLFLTAALFAALMIERDAGHDYIQFHAAAGLLSARESPYGRDEQLRAQRLLRGGVDLRDIEPNDLYSELGFLPYFYPPWVALSIVPLTVFEYSTAKALWIYLGAQSLVVAGFSLRNLLSFRRHHRALTIALALTFMPAFSALEIGQVAPFVLLLSAIFLELLKREEDLLGGFILAWLTIKPQLTVVAIPAALIWAARRRRWNVVVGFFATLGVLCILSAGFLADWPLRMVAAPRAFPLPTSVDPSVGVTWLSLCQTLRWKGWPLALAYLAAAIPAVFLTLRAAWNRNGPLIETFGRGILAVFFVAPYALGYDLATLVLPLLVVDSKLSKRAGTWLIGVAMIVPYWNLSAVRAGVPQVSFFWMPVALAAVWFWVEGRKMPGLIPPQP